MPILDYFKILLFFLLVGFLIFGCASIGIFSSCIVLSFYVTATFMFSVYLDRLSRLFLYGASIESRQQRLSAWRVYCVLFTLVSKHISWCWFRNSAIFAFCFSPKTSRHSHLGRAYSLFPSRSWVAMIAPE